MTAKLGLVVKKTFEHDFRTRTQIKRQSILDSVLIGNIKTINTR